MPISKWINPNIKQIWVSLPVFLTKIGAGMNLGFASCLLTAIQDPKSDIKMDIHTSSWYVSSIALSFVIGFFIASCTISRFGRKLALIIHCLPAIIGQLTTYFSANVSSLMIGRILTGITMSSNALTGIVVIGEYTSPQNRGMFLNMVSTYINVGSLIVHTVGYYTTWRMLALIILIPFVLCLLIGLTLPESPSWLAERKKYEKSREAFYWLRGRTEESIREIEELIRAQNHKKIDKTAKENVVDFFLKFKKKNFLKPIIVTWLGVILMETSGKHYFPSYAAQLIKAIMSKGFNIQYFNIVIDILIICSGFTASYLIRIMKMRTLLFTSGSATVVTLILACLSLYLVKNGIILAEYSWISLTLFSFFFIFANLGCNCIPLALKGELFPLEHRAVASMISFGLTAATMAVFLKLLPFMVFRFQIYGAYFILAMCMGVMLTVLYYLLPETKDRTLQQIEDYFNDKREVDDTRADDDETQKLNEV